MSNQSIEIFVINLETSLDRRISIQYQLDSLRENLGQEINYQFFDAVNGKENPDYPLFKKYNAEKRLSRKGHQMSLSQLGCFASHYLLWQKCVELNRSIIVLEDDAIIDDNFPNVYQFVGSPKNIFEFFWLSPAGRGGQKGKFISSIDDKNSLYQYFKGWQNATGYYITPMAAKKLLDFSEEWIYDLDITMDRYWENKIPYLAVYPACVHPEDNVLGSTIFQDKGNKNRTLLMKLRREYYKIQDILKKKYFDLFQNNLSRKFSSSLNDVVLSIICYKFKAGGGSERYILDIVNGFHQINKKMKAYSLGFDKNLPAYQFIEPIKVNLSYIPKQFRLPFFSYLINKNKTANEVTLSMTQVKADILFCGGLHKGYLKAMSKSPSLMDKFKIVNEEKSYAFAKKIVAHSALMKKELIEFYDVEPEKIDVIYPPVDTEKFTLPSDEKRNKLRRQLGFENEIVYLFPSTGHSRKGFDILKAFFENTDLPVKLVVAGTPVKSCKNIISLGFRNDMPELYQAADFTIMASIYEPFGLVGVESILSGTPVIFSDNMACLEVMKENFGFSFQRDNLSSLESAVINSVELVNSGQARIENPALILNYNPKLDHHIQQLNNIVEEVKTLG